VRSEIPVAPKVKQSTPVVNAADAKASSGADAVLDLPTPWRLHYGDVLPTPRISYRLVGPSEAPVVAVLGGISAHRFVTDAADSQGWWRDVTGPGRGIDTTRFRVLGMDYVGGWGSSSTPDGKSPFPPISSFDQAEALREVVTHLGVKSLHAIVGASYGGMVGLCFAARYSSLVERIVVVSAADRAQILSTAWRSVQRQIVREAVARGDGPSGLKLARALAMATYRSQPEFTARFSGPPVRDAERFRFPVESYLFARGDDYVQKYRAESFLALSESIDLHHVDATQVHTPATLIAVTQDQLVPFADMQALAARLGGPYKLVELDSIFGHDAFLKESARLNPLLNAALAEQFT
jgi:homoserine O-acetyltransferase